MKIVKVVSLIQFMTRIVRSLFIKINALCVIMAFTFPMVFVLNVK